MAYFQKKVLLQTMLLLLTPCQVDRLRDAQHSQQRRSMLGVLAVGRVSWAEQLRLIGSNSWPAGGQRGSADHRHAREAVQAAVVACKSTYTQCAVVSAGHMAALQDGAANHCRLQRCLHSPMRDCSMRSAGDCSYACATSCCCC
jgi:hypothetical protein